MPNLLFMFTDEQRADTLAAYGNRKIEMPNLDGLAAEGTVFEKTYVTQPVCTPSRSSLLTGLYPHTNGCVANNVPLPTSVACLPEMLPRGEFATGYHGKWHLGDEIFAQHGFDDWRSIEDMYHKYYRPGTGNDVRSSYHHFLVESGFEPENQGYFGRGQCAHLPEEYGKPAYLAQEASRFIREHASESFVLFVNFLEPHMPFTGPRDSQYDPAFVDLPPNFDNLPTEDQPLKTRIFRRSYYDRGHGGFRLQTENDWRRLIANYWGLCSLVDTHAGTIMNTLKECGLYDDTIIVFTSDHGDMMGSHRLLAKCVMFEEATTVPLIVRLPGQQKATRIRDPVSQIDLLPTLLDFLDVKFPPNLEGRSLRPLMEGDSSGWDVVVEWNGRDSGVPWKARVAGLESVALPDGADEETAAAALLDPVRTIITPDRWKFNCSPLGEHELYDLTEDPYETKNLAGRREMKPMMTELVERIRVWQKATRDGISLPNPLFAG